MMNGYPMIMMVLAIKAWAVALIVVAVLLLVAFIALGIYGRKLQAKSDASQAELRAAAQSMTMLVIDKKRMKLKDAGLPQILLDQTPKYLRGSKLPIVKAKIGPRIMPLICEEKIFDLIPLKKEIRASVSGIYILDVKGLRNNSLEKRPEKKKGRKKKGKKE